MIFLLHLSVTRKSLFEDFRSMGMVSERARGEKGRGRRREGFRNWLMFGLSRV
jgi:hypothetical protein